MKEYERTSKNAKKNYEQTVRRAPELAKDGLSADHEAKLIDSVEERCRSLAGQNARIRDLTLRGYEPIRRMIEADSSAIAALRDLKAERLAAIEQRIASPSAPRTFGGGGPKLGDLITDLHTGINIFVRPFDFPVQRADGELVSTHANKVDGTFGFFMGAGTAVSHARFATAGVGLLMEATVTGVAHIRPAWSYNYFAYASGSSLGSHTEGVGKVVVEDVLTDQVLGGEFISPLWNFDNDNEQSDMGWVDSWALGAKVSVQAGQLLRVFFLASGMVDDSGSYAFAWSHAVARLDMQLNFVVVELTP